MNALTPGSTIETFHDLIDKTDKAEGTKDKYKRAIAGALRSGVDLSSRRAIQVYAQGLSKSGRGHLKSVITMLVNEYKEELEASVTADTLVDTQVKLMRLNAIARAIKVKAGEGQKAHIWLSMAETKELLATCDETTNKGRRDKIVLGLMVGAGLRRNELCQLSFLDIKAQPRKKAGHRTVLEILGKGSKNRVVPISDRLAGAIAEWRMIVAGGDGLVTRSVLKGGKVGDSLSPVGAFNIVAVAGAAIGKPELAPHDLRRTYAQLGYEAGVPITQISKLLGHSNVATTQRYLNLELDLETTISDFIPFE